MLKVPLDIGHYSLQLWLQTHSKRFAFLHLFEGADGKQLKIHGLLISHICFTHNASLRSERFILFSKLST